MKSQVLNIQENVMLAPYTTFKIGGPARFFVEVSSEEEILEALNFAKENNLEVFVLGGGSNVVISDEGFDGLVIHIQDTRYKIQDTNLECGAGLPLSEAVRLAKNNSLAGLEWAAGIPGTVGGAVRGNAGAFGGCMADSVVEVRYFDLREWGRLNTEQSQKSKVKSFVKSDCNFSYRKSIFKESNNLIILSVVLALSMRNKAEIEAKMKEILTKRAEKQPQGFSAGSFFQNPEVNNAELIKRFEKDTGVICKDNKLPAGWIVTEAGFSGKKIGGVQVSEKHANFVINNGGGKAQEIVMLASIIKQKVRKDFGIQLKEEVQYVGF